MQQPATRIAAKRCPVGSNAHRETSWDVEQQQQGRNQRSVSERLSRPRRQAVRAPLDLANVTDETLLAARLCDLQPTENTLMARRVARLHGELRSRGIVARPHAWLSEEFFSPEGVLGFAIPFYLAHPRLMRLERSQMLEVEGAGEAECRRILRHEPGTPSTTRMRSAGAELSRSVRRSRSTISGLLQASAGEPRLRHQSRQLVRAGASGRRLCRDLRDLAQSPHRLARRLQGLASAGARVRRRADARDRRQAARGGEHFRGRAVEESAAHARRALRGEANILCVGLASELRPGLAPHFLRRSQRRRRATRHVFAPRPTAIADAHCGRNRSALPMPSISS